MPLAKNSVRFKFSVILYFKGRPIYLLDRSSLPKPHIPLSSHSSACGELREFITGIEHSCQSARELGWYWDCLLPLSPERLLSRYRYSRSPVLAEVSGVLWLLPLLKKKNGSLKIVII